MKHMTTQQNELPLGTTVKFEKTRSHQKYIKPDGRQVPGVTTVLNILNKPALVPWAHKLGLQGIDYKAVSNQAAGIGTLAHFMCECHLKGLKADLSEFSPADVSKAESAFIKFLQFWDEGKYTILQNELQIVHPSMNYGGTLDIMATDGSGKIALIDLKTSNGIYDEYIYQLAAYEQLWNAVNLKTPIDKRIIVRIGKEDADDLEIRELSDLTKHMNVFISCLGVYEAQKALKPTEPTWKVKKKVAK